MNYPTIDTDQERMVDWDADKQALAEMVRVWGFESIRDLLNKLNPESHTFAYGYDDNSHLIHHRDNEF